MAKKTPKADSPSAPTGDTYTVLARRYRPQNFTELIGQEPVARALGNALSGNRVAHAYLFTGARGVGKTSTARILAKALNCVQGPTPTPCGVCDICVSIASGEDVDVIEMDAASNRGIDEIRDIRGNVQYRPSRARFKIYIIDEVHMLTKEAFNALLKTLEEPPGHVKFIFATTDAQKVPITILSRCQRFDFAGISLPRIVEQLRMIVEAEGLHADPEALELVARRAGGSMRDAQSLLDQLLAFATERLTTDQVHHLLGTAGDDRVINLAEAVVQKNAALTLDQLAEVSVSGLQLGELLDQLITYWRDLMVVNVGGTKGRDLSIPARHHATIEKHARALPLDAILAGLDVLTTAKARLRGSNHARTLVEMALVRLVNLSDLVPLSRLVGMIGQMGSAPIAPQSARPMTPPPEAVKKNMTTPVVDAGPVSVENWSGFWPRLLPVLGPAFGMQLSKSGSPAIIGPNSLAFRFPFVYNQECEYCRQPERVARLEAGLKKLTDETWTVKIESGQPAATEPTATVEAPTKGPKRSPKDEAQAVPLVKRVVDVLGGSITRVDDGFGLDKTSEGSEGA